MSTTSAGQTFGYVSVQLDKISKRSGEAQNLIGRDDLAGLKAATTEILEWALNIQKALDLDAQLAEATQPTEPPSEQ